MSRASIKKRIRKIEAEIAKKQAADAGEGTARLEFWSASEDGETMTAKEDYHTQREADRSHTVQLISVPSKRFLRSVERERAAAHKRGLPYPVDPLPVRPTWARSTEPALQEDGTSIWLTKRGPDLVPLQTAAQAMERLSVTGNPESVRSVKLSLVDGDEDDTRMIYDLDQNPAHVADDAFDTIDADEYDDETNEDEAEALPRRVVPELKIVGETGDDSGVEWDVSGPDIKAVAVDLEAHRAKMKAEAAANQTTIDVPPGFEEIVAAGPTPNMTRAEREKQLLAEGKSALDAAMISRREFA